MNSPSCFKITKKAIADWLSANNRLPLTVQKKLGFKTSEFMIYIASVILISSLIFVTFKFFDKYKVENFQAITINYLIASICGLLIAPITDFQVEILDKPWFYYAIGIGIIFIATFLLFALSSQKAGVAITAVFSKMSVIIPVIMGIFLYSESLNLLKIAGIIFTFAAFFLVFYKKESSKIQWAVIILPILIFFGNGFIDTMLKYIEYHFIKNDINFFLTVIFITAFISGFIVLLGKFAKTRKMFTLNTFIGGTVLGLLNYATTYFMIMAMSKFESNVLFPIQNVGIVMVSALFGLILFREKLSLINWIGIFAAISAILLIAIA